MNRSFIRSRSRIVTFLLGAAAVVTVIAVIRHPSESFYASLGGLQLWWNILFPALLPYYILCDIAAAYGLKQAVGTALGCAGRWLFRLPKSSGIALGAGILYGTPAGAQHAVTLKQKLSITETEAARVTAASHLVSPVLIITVIAAVLMKQPAYSFFILIVHYLSFIICGWLLRYYPDASAPTSTAARRLLPEANENKRRSLGQIMGDSVTDALQRLMEIGGIIIFFSVAIRISGELGITDVLNRLLQPILIVLHVPEGAFLPLLISGIEVHLGAYALATSTLPRNWMMSLLSAMLAWGGLAAHLQVKAFIQKAGIRYTPYLVARLLQAAIAFGLSFMLWNLFHALLT